MRLAQRSLRQRREFQLSRFELVSSGRSRAALLDLLEGTTQLRALTAFSVELRAQLELLATLGVELRAQFDVLVAFGVEFSAKLSVLAALGVERRPLTPISVQVGALARELVLEIGALAIQL